VAEKLTHAKLVVADLIVAIESQLMNLVNEQDDPEFQTRIDRLERSLEKSTRIRDALEKSEWPASDDSLVELEDISGGIVEVSKDIEPLLSHKQLKKKA